MYIVENLKIKNDTVLLSLKENDNSLDVLLLLDCYLEHPYQKEQEITQDEISQLLKEESYSLAYLAALKKLKYKDRTVSELRDYLEFEFDLDTKVLKDILNKLLQKGYLDDERYCFTYIENAYLQYKGKRLIEKECKEKGLENTLVQKCLDEQKVDESELAVNYAKKIKKGVKNKSLKATKQFLYQKLMLRGFESSICDETIQKLDFSDFMENDKEMIQKVYQKAKKRYERKYNRKECKNKIIQYLLTQGFQYSDIRQVVSSKEEFDDGEEIY